MRTRLFVALLMGLATASLSLATPVIDVGTIILQANSGSQTVELSVSGGDAVTGFNLKAQIGDGVNPSPVFQSVAFTGGIWDAFANTVTGGPVSGAEQYAQAAVAFNTSVTVPASGKFVKLVLDTTGITTDSFYSFNLKDTDIGAPSDFVLIGGGTVVPTITNGTIHVVVPEPASLGLLGLASFAFAMRRRR